MKRKTAGILLFSIVILTRCSAPQDPVDRFVRYMDKRMDILEKYKEDPADAGVAIENYNYGKETEMAELIGELKRYERKVTEEKNQEIMIKLKPLHDRIIKLIEESPTLFLDDRVAGAFEAFDLGL